MALTHAVFLSALKNRKKISDIYSTANVCYSLKTESIIKIRTMSKSYIYRQSNNYCTYSLVVVNYR